MDKQLQLIKDHEAEKLYKRQLNRFRRKISNIRKAKEKTIESMKSSLVFGIAIEYNQKYYRNKIEKLSQQEEKTIRDSKKFLKQFNKQFDSHISD